MQKSTLTTVVRALKPARLTSSEGIPIMHHVRVIRDATGWHFHRTNSELFIAVDLPDQPADSAVARSLAAVRAKREAMDITLPFSTFEKCVAAADPGSEIEFAPDSLPGARNMHALRIAVSGAACRIPACGLPAAEFPQEPPVTGEDFPVAQAHADALHAAQSCVSQDETRYVLMGAQWEESAIISTDGRRLYAATGLPPHPFPPMIVPLSALPLVQAGMTLHRSSDAPDRHRAVFTSRANGLVTRIHATIIDGNYPNWKQVVPSESRFSARFDRTQVTKALATMRRTLNAKVPSVGVVVGTRCLTFSMNEPEAGRAEVTVPALFTPPCTKVFAAFNPDYFLDALGMGFDTIDIIDEMSPAVLRHPKHPGAFYVLMPMRVTV